MSDRSTPIVPIPNETILWDKETDEDKDVNLPPSSSKMCAACGRIYYIDFERCPSCTSSDYEWVLSGCSRIYG